MSYVDRETGEAMAVAAKLLPLAPSASRLPWSVENLRTCPTCEQLVQQDLNYCPYDGRRLPPVDGIVGPGEVQPPLAQDQ
jgi:hypothetical protein